MHQETIAVSLALLAVIVTATVCIFALNVKIAELRRELRSKGLDLAMAVFEAKLFEGCLNAAESALRYHENRYKKDIAYWKAKDKASRTRAWEAEQLTIEKAKRIRKLLDKEKE